MSWLLSTVFLASLLGSLHCVGMCGPFALLASSPGPKTHSTYLPTMAYSTGRLVTYMIVGLIFGSIGMALNVGASFNQWQQAATLVAGLLMIGVGAIALGRYFGLQIRLPKLLSPVQQLLESGFVFAKNLPPVYRAFTIGALSSLMPCGWLYTFAIAAAGTGSPVWGGALMIAFWAGTVPIMVALMLGIGKIGLGIQQRLPAIMAGLVIAIGLFTVIFRSPIAVADDQEVVRDHGQIVKKIQTIEHDELPCCSGGKTVEPK